ncbi:lactonase family protein [Bdellovibrio sp. HCB209]|uniref:lactonase family protein n=1 Tax=Bdellovibrio sp. HCB209 TaxID=3394354 RepID=UPI0039B4A6C1
MRSIIAIALVLLVGCSKSSNGGGVTPTPSPITDPAKFAFVLNTGDETLSSFSIESDGSLTPLTVAIGTGNFPKAMVMSKLHDTVYVANLGGDSISSYKIGTDGTLTALGDISAGVIPEALIVSPDQKFLYSMNPSGEEIRQFAIGSDGTLSFVNALSHPDGAVQMTFSPSGEYAYVVNLSTTDISQFKVNSDGTLAELSPARVASLGCPSGPITSKTAKDGGENVYALSCSTDEVEVFKIGQGGQLSSTQTLKTGSLPMSMSIADENLYVNNLGDSTISQYAIQNDGSLVAVPQGTVASGVQAEGIAVDGGGKKAFVVDAGNDQILSYSVNSAYELVPVMTVNSGAFPTQILLK